MLGPDQRLTTECESALNDIPEKPVGGPDRSSSALVIEVKVAGAKPLNQFLRMAVMAGVESAVQIHIERGDDLNARDASGMTSLMLCAARNKPAICKLLLSAGADHSLVAPSGKTALEIAVAAGSYDAAAILHAVPPALAAHSVLEIALDSPSTPVGSPALSLGTQANGSEKALGHAEIENPTEPLAPAGSLAKEVDDGEFDLSAWETEEEPTRPEVDFAVMDSASAIQITITAHEPIDSSIAWDDIDAYLPEVAMPLSSPDDAEGRAQLRRLLLRALREGSVPCLDVQAQSTNEDRTSNLEAEAFLSMVINDLGAEVDERFEYSTANESFEVFIEPDETPDEEAALDEALVAIDRASSPRHEPLRIYQREFQRLRLLTAEEEIQLAKDMEAALDDALDALAAWPDGIARTIVASAQAIAGSRPLSSVWSGSAEPDLVAALPESLEEPGPAYDAPPNEDSEQAEVTTTDADESNFSDALEGLAAAVERGNGSEGQLQEIRQALSDLRLNRRFLLELIEAAHGLAPCPGFARAMANFRKARDWMTGANLKLAFFHAKKFLHSGEPLDDLAQEGNIGLLKAIDRYDWRRGFRFSTYATWWIRQQISRHVADKARTIRIPVHIHEKVQRMERIARTFEDAGGRKPTLAELTDRMEMPSHKLSPLLHIAPEPSRIDELTLDGLIAIDARNDYVSPDPADVVDKMQLNQALERYISSLSAKNRREEQILRLRFGIGVDEALTLEEIGTLFDVTRERVRQLEAKAIRKLRHPVRSEPFARLVLGLESDENPLALGGQEPDETDGPGISRAAAMPSAERRPAPPRPSREPIQPAVASKPSTLEQLLKQTTDLGINVEDDRLNSGRIWVELVEARDNKHRRLVRRLLEFGFEFWPGKGYWK